MRRFTTATAVLLVVLAASVLGAASASAKPQKLVLYSSEPETLVAPGDNFQMVLYHWSNAGIGPNSFSVQTSVGTVTCVGTEFPFSGLGGQDLTNGEAIDKVQINESAGALAYGTKCSNTSPLGTEAEVYVAPQAAILNLAGSKGKAELKAKSKTEPIYVEVSYSGGAFCAYSATNWKGTLTFEEQGTERQIITTFTKVKVKLAKNFSSSVCDKKTTITASFGYQNRGDFSGFGEGHFIFGKLL